MCGVGDATILSTLWREWASHKIDLRASKVFAYLSLLNQRRACIRGYTIEQTRDSGCTADVVECTVKDEVWDGRC